MSQLPKRHSLVQQAADLLQEGIASGRWKDWLPGERDICIQFQVSRNTVRLALGQLQKHGLIRAIHGSGYRILTKPLAVKSPPVEKNAALLIPEMPMPLRPSQVAWIDELRAMLGEHNYLLRIFYGRQYLSRNPGPALRKLVEQHQHSCWILMRTNVTIQKWFSKHCPRCLVVGSVYANLPLANRSLDHRAICRHAAGVLLGLGHRRIALMIPKPALAGDLESEDGFVGGMQASSHPDTEAIMCWYEPAPEEIVRSVRRLLARKLPPTALIVANTYHYLVVWSYLVRTGIRIPEEMSILCRDDDQFLSYLIPVPARYVLPPEKQAKAVMRAVLEIIETGETVSHKMKFLPTFEMGHTVAPCPKAGDN